MYDLLVRLFFAAALLELGHAAIQPNKCESRQCLGRMERLSRQALHVQWKPISVFPEEARRLREAAR
ncbi:MAG: hypothetical protein IPJ84_07745 [Bdellovibrionales bacterium]|nr:hypothetical protein [Bdellovibrionales bacterium]